MLALSNAPKILLWQQDPKKSQNQKVSLTTSAVKLDYEMALVNAKSRKIFVTLGCTFLWKHFQCLRFLITYLIQGDAMSISIGEGKTFLSQ